MTIWSAEIKELETLYTSIKGRFPELEKELDQLIETKDANVVLLYSRRCLEVIITDLCECELKRPRKTEPLKGIIDKLHHEEKIPSHIITSMQNLNSLSTYGAHPKEFEPEQVKPVLNNLTTIIKWYLKYKDTKIDVKTEAEEVKDETRTLDDYTKQIQKPKKRLVLLFSGLALIVIVVMALFVFNIIGEGKRIEELEKSIAVLPFIDDSQDKENTSFINGLMDEILINLQTIEDLRVISRNSVEQYRGSAKPSTPDIAKALGVNYIVQGSGQKYGNTFRLRVQLIDATKDRHLWGEVYEQKIEEIEDIFRIQSQVAQAIAGELNAVITPDEKFLIEKTPTTSLTALDFYQRGRDEFIKYWWIDTDNKAALEKAEDFYYKALEYDSAFAQAYTGLAWIYWSKHFWQEYFSETFLDSVLIFCDIALSYDSQVADAYIIKGNYFRVKGIVQKAIDEFDKALKINPNSWEAYYRKGLVYLNDDPVWSLDHYHKAVSLNRGAELPSLLREMAEVYIWAGFREIANNYYQEALILDGDSASFFYNLGEVEFALGNYEKAIEFYKKASAIDSTIIRNYLQIGHSYMYSGHHEESLRYFKKYFDKLTARGQLDTWNMHRIGYAYWQNGYKKETEYYFDMQMEYCNNTINSDRPYARLFYAYYDRAGVYAFRGNKEKAYEDLRIFNQRERQGYWMVTLIKNDPLFDSIRDEEEFQQIVRDMEAKYQAEHERVRKWLEENLPG